MITDYLNGNGFLKHFYEHPVSPEGIPTKGFKTRSNKRTRVFIVRRRSK